MIPQRQLGAVSARLLGKFPVTLQGRDVLPLLEIVFLRVAAPTRYLKDQSPVAKSVWLPLTLDIRLVPILSWGFGFVTGEWQLSPGCSESILKLKNLG